MSSFETLTRQVACHNVEGSSLFLDQQFREGSRTQHMYPGPGNVRWDSKDLCSSGGEIATGLCERLFFDVGQDDPHPLLRAAFSQRTADAAGRACHDGDFTLECFHDGSFFLAPRHIRRVAYLPATSHGSRDDEHVRAACAALLERGNRKGCCSLKKGGQFACIRLHIQVRIGRQQAGHHIDRLADSEGHHA